MMKVDYESYLVIKVILVKEVKSGDVLHVTMLKNYLSLFSPNIITMEKYLTIRKTFNGSLESFQKIIVRHETDLELMVNPLGRNLFLLIPIFA